MPTHQPPAAPEVNLDEHAALVLEYNQARDAMKAWQRVVEEKETALKELIGDAQILKFRGRQIGTWHPKNTFRGAQFKREHPDIAEYFTGFVTTEALKTEEIRTQRPDLWAQYQTREFKWTGLDS